MCALEETANSNDILSNPQSWPSSFPQPKAGTRVITYIFDKDPTEFKSFVAKNFPNAQLKESKDKKGFFSTSITEYFPKTNADDDDDDAYATGGNPDGLTSGIIAGEDAAAPTDATSFGAAAPTGANGAVTDDGSSSVAAAPTGAPGTAEADCFGHNNGSCFPGTGGGQ